jgi:hypothetical protein
MAPQAFQAAKKFLRRDRKERAGSVQQHSGKRPASDRDTQGEDRYQFESGFIAVASPHLA